MNLAQKQQFLKLAESLHGNHSRLAESALGRGRMAEFWLHVRIANAVKKVLDELTLGIFPPTISDEESFLRLNQRRK